MKSFEREYRAIVGANRTMGVRIVEAIARHYGETGAPIPVPFSGVP